MLLILVIILIVLLVAGGGYGYTGGRNFGTAGYGVGAFS